MKQIHSLLKYSLVLGCVLAPDSVLGQIVPDATLRVNSSVTQSSNKFTINGGTVVGGNLFHSFQHFNVPTGGEAFFNTASTIENIFTRVTGGSISNIDGILRANGSANLFLLNPNGIIFGPNASLNIGGSFIGSSAMSIKFADGTHFSATNQEAAPLLTVNVPIGLQFGTNPGGIIVQGTGHNLTLLSDYLPLQRSNSPGLRVQPGKTLALVGGTVDLNGGTLTAQGRVELGSVGGAGLVSLTPTAQGFTLGYGGVPSFGDIHLSQRALVDVSGAPAGSIQVQGRDLSISDGSLIVGQNWGMQPGGDININATSTLSLSGTTPDSNIPSALYTETVAPGKSGNISVSTGQLIIQSGGAIASKTFSGANGGNIDVNAAQSILLSGSSPINPLKISNIGSYTFSDRDPGKSGDVSVSTQNLSVLNGAFVSVSTVSGGKGQGGNLTVNADTTGVIGTTPKFSSSTLSAISFGFGNAGKITLNTRTLAIQDGGVVATASYTTGDAGSLTINASESVLVDGPTQISSISSSVTIPNEGVRQVFHLSGIPTTGNAGDVIINTPTLRVTNGALVNVSNEGVGKGGTLTVNAARVFIDNRGDITASTAAGVGGKIDLRSQELQLSNKSSITATAGGSGNGGNIFLQAQDLRLRFKSSITASAGITGGGNITTNSVGDTGKGGNITVDTGTLLALENSDIAANAQLGFGGRVMINAQGIFGSQDRITASSALGADFNGVVQFNTPDVDPSTAVVALPATVLDPTHQITAGCTAQRGNNFVVTGRGGLPSDPTSTLRGATLWADLRRVGGVGETRERDASLSSITSSSPSSPPTPHSPTPVASTGASAESGKPSVGIWRWGTPARRWLLPTPQSPIIEATGWVVDEHGSVELVAPPQLNTQQSWQKTPTCGEI